MQLRLKISQLGLLLAVSLILSYIESVLPFNFGIPGMKLGLPNLAIVLTLYLFGWQEALLINISRIILSGFMFGNLAGILFSLAGALVSFVCMLAAKRCRIFSAGAVSIVGGVMHNTGQLLIAVLIVKTVGILYYLPILLIAGMITGGLIGIVAMKTIPYLRKLVCDTGKETDYE
ncbi:MAG: Gx transporter family protein [Butyrivibrio sp.]|nr:Gx transporter family protein [Butyrivibrio sp.]